MNLSEAIKQLRSGNDVWISVSFGSEAIRFHIKPFSEDQIKYFPAGNPGDSIFVLRSGRAPIIGKVYKEGHGDTRTKLYEVFDTKTGKPLENSLYVSNSAILGFVEAEFKR